MSEEQIITLLQEGSLEAFLDCLDYAHVGVIDLVKKYAVSLPLNDVAKRKALLDKTGFDVSKALEHVREEKAEDLDNTDSATSNTTSGRRTTSNYKVIAKKEENKAE